MNHFFGIAVTGTSIGGMVLALILAVVLGGLIGLERELHAHPAGLRTHILVCLGSTVITLVSVWSANLSPHSSDPTRISAQIVTGVGFLGAGAILREGATVRGLTTAATLWVTAGIGLAIGTSPFLGQLAVVSAAIVLFTLWILEWVEDWIEVRIHRSSVLEVHVQDAEGAVGHVIRYLAERHVSVHGMDFESDPNRRVRQILMRVRLPVNFDKDQFLSGLAEGRTVVSVRMRDHG